VVGGLLAANKLLGEPYRPAQLLGEAVKLEHGRHADNVAPALLGGLVVNAAERGQFISVQVPWPEELKAVVFTPEFVMDTVKGRQLMPGGYSKADVVFSTSRVSLFLAALAQGHYELLKVAMQDKIHQPYRARIFPLFPKLIAAAQDAGAHGACLSGGGSSVLALATEHFEEIASAMRATAQEAGIEGEVRLLSADLQGAQIVVGVES
jgi:homoserine kinase